MNMKASCCAWIMLVLVSSCGRKNHSLFIFEAPQKQLSVELLSLPAVRCGVVHSLPNEVCVSWRAVENTPEGSLVGYLVYRLTRNGIVPKKPLNTIPLTVCEYRDVPGDGEHRYCVRALFLIQKKRIAGPASRVFFDS